MVRLLVVLMLTGCASEYSKDGTTVISYCLVGGVYMDDTRVEMKHEMKAADEAQCPRRVDVAPRVPINPR